jgi:hypothetical protein
MRIARKFAKEQKRKACSWLFLGSGFSVQAPFELTVGLPEILRDLARQIEESFEQGHA